MTRARGAAFFDLDRTLLAGASGEVISAAMRDVGILGRELPGQGLMFKLFNTIGETLPSMLLTRQAVRLAKGKSQRDMQRAAVKAAPELAEMLQPLAAGLFEEHRRAGRRLVLATTTPYDMISPLADLLDLDDVVATRYVVDDQGNYTGDLDGHFVWNTGKRDAVAEWATANGVDLAASYAYSDSFYDSPLLSAVGHPVAVNPDPRLVLLAAVRRWPTITLDHATTGFRIPVLNRDINSLTMELSNPRLMPYARMHVSGTENIPSSGPAIIVANHRSYFDGLAMASAVVRSKRSMRFLGKKEVFEVPVAGALLRAWGGISVERASGSDAPLRAAEEALENGEMVGLMPQGTIPRGRAFFDTELKARWGAARLAAATRAPVIPIGLWGTENVWPRSSRLPAVFNVLNPPDVTVTVGPPVELKYRSAEADTKRIMAAIVDLLPAEAREPYDPTPEELARTFPPGYKGDPMAESERRPGTDT